MAGAGGAVKIHPVLLPPSVELAPAYQVDAGVAALREIERKSTPAPPLMMPPPVFVMVNVPETPVSISWTKLPNDPEIVKSETVVVALGN